MAWDLKRSKAKERGEEGDKEGGQGGITEAGGGGYIRRVMAGMKPIANDAGIRDWQAKRCVASGPTRASRCLPACLPAVCLAAWPARLKYLREVTPYFRKASIIQEVGWELQRGFLSATPPPPKSPPRADTRYLPLQLCRLTRAHP
ncbi:hypothetical protein G5I_13564 [Acromyrmex echinatior]|uniref:Uncharacterized protein n=1 Tax=Acromyrmex echinatior TaxID=103372 RepID=F4X5D2_ACREC|nr:hypothetical protein G5I_13564 [Acromyrmex echinatior]